MAKILHVDDDPAWRSIIKNNGDVHNVHVDSFDNLEAAETAIRLYEYDGYVFDGTVEKPSDGARSAVNAYSLGKNVVLLSGNYPPPELHGRYLDKGTFSFSKLLTILGLAILVLACAIPSFF